MKKLRQFLRVCKKTSYNMNLMEDRFAKYLFYK